MENEMEQQEARSDRFIKFDLSKRKSGPYNYSVDNHQYNKRKSSLPLSNEFLQSPQSKDVKQHREQYPGHSYFSNMRSCREIVQIKDINENDEITAIQHLERSPINPNMLTSQLRRSIEQSGYTGIYSNISITNLIKSERQRFHKYNDKSQPYHQLGMEYSSKANTSLGLSQITIFKTDRNGTFCNEETIFDSTTLDEGGRDETDFDRRVPTRFINRNFLQRSNNKEIVWKDVTDAFNSEVSYQRSEASCRHRWQNHLDPCISRQEWSNDEDLSLLELILKFGKRWRYIQQEWKLPTKRTLRQMSNRLVMLLENEKKFFTPLHCIPRSRREIKPVQDSGYDSDTSSCSSSADTQLTNQERKSIAEMIKNLSDQCHRSSHRDLMHTEKDEKQLVERKKKLRNLVHHDLQMSEREIKVSREVTDHGTRMKIERSPTSQDSKGARGTPIMMSNLSRNLSSMNISDGNRQSAKQVVLNVEPTEQLSLDDMNYLQFSVVNQRTGAIFFLTPDNVRQLMEQMEEKRFQEEMDSLNYQGMEQDQIEEQN